MTVTSCLLSHGWASLGAGLAAKLDQHSGRHPADLRRADSGLSRPSFVTNRTPQRNILILCGISDVVGATASCRSDSPYRRESLLRDRRKSQKELNKNIVYFRSPAAAKLGVAPTIRGSPGSRQARTGSCRSRPALAIYAAQHRLQRGLVRPDGAEDVGHGGSHLSRPLEKQMISLRAVLVVRIQAIRPCGRGPRNSAGRREGTNVCDTRRCRREMEGRGAFETAARPPV